ncbi:uncharacterized protein PFL1_03801 [Pseudozyma flocculosa PF-1]|uniref:Zn(2)-C6 fungal-type domain-containing protein n=2 Tax=Pseudozyma flocculosa TaxID=84751 RepID=A0A5C3EZ34_9BASI|nr:uncharacterized protein PFL1_03801 [Pseudozyma flocculosa PF-1]EPQ28498.1 hypothetical protein PFL1_03801 [Pseudozyma flocculosa PF-1]SPO36419.1 uncharacterized protein PSFLO_01890 [Pseudozyma flocculosa]
MPPAATGGSSRRKQGQPTVCLDCYLRKVKCDRKRPCSTCIRRGTEHLCKTFSTQELDPAALKKKQARRSMAELTALTEAAAASASAAARDAQQDPSESGRSDGRSLDVANHHNGGGGSSSSASTTTAGESRGVEAPLTSFINLLLQDLSVGDEEYSSGGGSPGSLSGAGPSSTPPPGASRYMEPKTLDVILAFCAMVPDLPRLSRLVNIYLLDVDWKFMLTAQDYFEDYVRDLWQRVVMPCQDYHRSGQTGATLEACFRPGDLSRLTMLAGFLCETVECLDPITIPDLVPASVSGTTSLPKGAARSAEEAFDDAAAATPRVRALSVLIHHLQTLIEECERLDEMTVDLVQSNLTAFTVWASQGMFGLSDFPRWELTIRAARESKLFEDPERLGITDPLLLDHRRRLGWLVYGYDHSFAVGANVKPLILESQFSVDRPSDAPPWLASGVPADPTLARCEVEVAEIAKQLAICNAAEGPPLHRKVMEVDQQILNFIRGLHPTYALEQPDLSMDQHDPWRSRRRPWLGLNLCWQRSILHRQFFFPNGRINNGELATSRHIAIDSSLRALEKIREVKRVQNRFSDWQGSAWYYQYMTEPSITLATATLLLLRSRGKGIPGLADEAACWPTVFHFCKIIDLSIVEIDHSMQDPALCLPSFLGFGRRCSQMLVQLRTTIQSGVDALLTKANGGVASVGLRFDEKLAGLLNPRARTRSPSHDGGTTRESISSAGSSGASPRPSISSSSFAPLAAPRSQPHQAAQWQPGEARNSSFYGSGGGDEGAGTAAGSSSVRSSGASSTAISPATMQNETWFAAGDAPALLQPPAHQPTSEAPQLLGQQFASLDQHGGTSAAPGYPPNMATGLPALSTSTYDPHSNSWSAGPAVPAPHLSAAASVEMLAPLDVSQALDVGGGGGGAGGLGAFDAVLSPTNTISSMEPSALRSYYTDDRVQRAAHENRGLSDWIAGVQSGVMLPPPG